MKSHLFCITESSSHLYPYQNLTLHACLLNESIHLFKTKQKSYWPQTFEQYMVIQKQFFFWSDLGIPSSHRLTKHIHKNHNICILITPLYLITLRIGKEMVWHRTGLYQKVQPSERLQAETKMKRHLCLNWSCLNFYV